MAGTNDEVDGHVRFGADGVWIGADFALQPGRLAIRRRITSDVHWLELGSIVGIDEIAPATAGQQTIEFALTDGSLVGAQLPPDFVAELVGRLTSEPAATQPETNVPPAAAGGASEPPPPPPGVQGFATPPANSNPLAGISKRKLAMVAGVAVVAMLATVTAGWWLIFGRSSEPTTPGPNAVGVQFSLLDADDNITGTLGDCSGSGGYSDFGPGMDIEITDQDGKIIGSGSTMSLSTLQDEQPEYFEEAFSAFAEPGESDDDLQLDDDALVMCIVAALVPIEGGADFYKVDVGRRGDLSYSYKEMEENDWSVSLSLGP